MAQSSSEIALDAGTAVRNSPKKLITAAVAGGYDVHAYEVGEFIPGEVFKGGQRAGERRPDKTVTVLRVTAKAPGVALYATWVDGRFQDALVWDSVGWPEILAFDYSINKIERRRLGISDAIAEERTARRDYAYNDGVTWVNRSVRLVGTVADFEEWAGDVIPAYPKKKVKVKTTETVEPLLAQIGEEWHG